jgi:hypothetical protein
VALTSERPLSLPGVVGRISVGHFLSESTSAQSLENPGFVALDAETLWADAEPCFLRPVPDDGVKRLPEQSDGLAPNALPTETVRDLLGIVRVLFALHRRRGNHGLARRLQHAGKQLRCALELALGSGDAAAHEEAWHLANEAIETIGRVQISAPYENLGAAVQLAYERVQNRQYPDTRAAKREARIKRG